MINDPTIIRESPSLRNLYKFCYNNKYRILIAEEIIIKILRQRERENRRIERKMELKNYWNESASD